MADEGPQQPPKQYLACCVACWLLQDEFDDRRHYIKPCANKATEGHALGAQHTIAAAEAAAAGGSKQWKMKRFEKNAQPRITQYMYGPQQHWEHAEQHEQQQVDEHEQQDC